ncbi:CusA/CzcA family heavy metal efflux RND transporter [bacterium]|nr:CusA/CzcA family heavy metal efflux RND transporter [bacterium]
MIEKILQTALRRRPFVIGLGLACLVGGMWSWSELQKEAYPDVGDTQVTVISEFQGRATEEVESQVTLPLERVLNSVPRVITRRSKTIFGLSVIYLTFEDGVEDYWARQRVLEKLGEAELPEGVKPDLAPLTGPVGEIVRYVLEGGEAYTPMDLRTLQDWVVTPQLLQVQGIADVITFGGLVKQFHVITSPEKLNKYDMTIQDVIDAIQENNLSTGGNVLRRGGQGFVIRGIGSIHSGEEIENIVVSSKHGVPIFIKNLATVEPFPMAPSGILGIASRETMDSEATDSSSSVQGLIAMRRGENASVVVDRIKAKINEINATELPDGVKVRVTYDRGELVNFTIRTVSHTLFEGISIVVIILVFFIGSIRSALVVATTIPLSLLFAFIMMKLTGIPANLLSLGAIDFGIIVDGAVVMTENILRRYQLASPEEKRVGILHHTFLAAREVSREIFFSILIIVAAYLPIFTFQRVEGKLFAPMASTLAFAIVGSMILALTLIPVLMSLLYRKYFESGETQHLEWHNPITAWMKSAYAKLVVGWTSRPVRTVTAAMGGVAVVMLAGLLTIGTEFLPKLDEGAVNIRAIFPVGISLQEANNYTKTIRDEIMAFKPVKLAITQLGRNEDGTDPYSPNRLEILVALHDYNLWQKDYSKDELLARVRKRLQAAVPGVNFSFSQPILDNVTEAVTGSVADLAILINGQDLKAMRKKGQELLAQIRQVPGATETGIEQEADQAQLVVAIDRAQIARYGINVADVQRLIEVAIGGKKVSTVYDDGRRFDIVARYVPRYRSSMDAIKTMQVRSPTGARIPLEQLARIELIDGPTLIQRQDGKRQISVRTNIRGRDQGSFVAEAQKRIQREVAMDKGTSLAWGGQFENLTRAGKRLELVLPITIAIIFCILFALYRDTWHVLIAFSCIPFSIAGGLLALMLRGYSLNVSAGVGFISLFGIATMSGVLFVSRMRQLQADNPGGQILDQVREAAAIQFRPWLTTILPALFGLIPATLATGIGSDVQRPLATVIVGGLTSGLFLTLIALPPLFLLVERLRSKYGREPSCPSPEKLVAGLLLCLLLPTQLHAADAAPTPLTLVQAEQRFLEKNLEVLAAKLDVDASEAAIVQAGLWSNPSLSIEQNIYNPNTKKWFDTTPTGNTDIHIQQLFNIAGRYGDQVQVAKSKREASEQGLRDTVRNLKRSLRSAYYSLHYNRIALAFYEKSASSLEKVVAAMEKLSQARSILPTELLRVKSLLLTTQTEKLSLLSKIRELEGTLRILIGTSNTEGETFTTVVDTGKLDKLHVPVELAAALDKARELRPDLKGRDAQLRAEEAGLSLNRALAWPEIGLGLSYSRAGSYIPEYYALSLSMDLPFFNRNQGAIAESLKNVEKTSRLRDQALRELENEVTMAFYKAKDTDGIFQSMDRNLGANYESLMDKMIYNYQKQNIAVIAFADFFETCRTSVNQLIQMQIDRMTAFEELNHAVATDIVQID